VRVEHVALEPDERVVRVGLARAPVEPSDPFLFHKTTNRRTYDTARLPGLDDTLLWTPDGDLTESTIANLVVEMDGRRVTPPVACGLLPGTFRAELLAMGEIVEGRVRLEDLRRASQVWLVNSVRGWRRAMLVD
jgi:para-aminobenzoate synthetase/4-amino-4-deoxychorismate lyase